MTYISGHDRSQLLLLLEAVDDYVGADNPVRFLDAFVDGLDLAAAGFGRVAPKVTGRFPKSFVSLCCSVANWTCLLDGRYPYLEESAARCEQHSAFKACPQAV